MEWWELSSKTPTLKRRAWGTRRADLPVAGKFAAKMAALRAKEWWDTKRKSGEPRKWLAAFLFSRGRD